MDITLPYHFDLFWDIKSLGHLRNALINDYIRDPKELEASMKEYGINQETFVTYLSPIKDEATIYEPEEDGC